MAVTFPPALRKKVWQRAPETTIEEALDLECAVHSFRAGIIRPRRAGSTATSKESLRAEREMEREVKRASHYTSASSRLLCARAALICYAAAALARMLLLLAAVLPAYSRYHRPP